MLLQLLKKPVAANFAGAQSLDSLRSVSFNAGNFFLSGCQFQS
jgi:hypothetical protein